MNEKLSYSILKSFGTFLELYDKKVSKNILIEDMPKDKNHSIPDMLKLYQDELVFTQIAKKVDMKAKLVTKDFRHLTRLYFPCIAFLNDDTTCILEDIDFQKDVATIYLSSGEKDLISTKRLEELYDGRLFLLKKEYLSKVTPEHLLEQNHKHWFWGSVLKNAALYKDIIIASILINIFVLVSPFFVMNVYDRVVPNYALETLWALAVGIVIIYIFDMSVKFIRAYFIDIVSKKIDISVSSKLFDKVLNIKLENRPKSVGSFASNIKDFEMIKNFFSSGTISVLVDMPFVVLFLVAIMYISGFIVIIPMVFILLILAYSLFIRKPLHKSIEATNHAHSFKNGILIESLNSLETIKGLGTSGNLRYKWEESTADISTKSIFTKLLTTSVSNVNAFFMQLDTVCVVIYGVYAVNERELTLGGLIAAVILSSRAIAPMVQFASLLSNYEQAKSSYNAIENIMQLPEEKKGSNAAISKEKIDGDVEFKSVSFFYNENKKVLQDLNFKIKKGEKVAFIGKIGSGKSTIMKLLMKLYEAKEGEIILDGVEIGQINPLDIRKNIAYVSQDGLLFNGTIKENILYKYPNEDDKKLLKVAKMTQLLDFINAHPQGFEMEVGERGETLSGGQRKAISLARSLIGEYSILLLDEPTDSMDLTTERELINALKNEIEDKTMLLVTHKNSMLELVDRIVVMDGGKIVLDGEKNYVLQALTGKKQ